MVNQPSSGRDVRFRAFVNELYQTLQLHPFSSPEVSRALKRVTARYPVPAVDVVAPDLWGEAFVRMNIHVKADYSAAYANIVCATGRGLSPDDERALKLLLTHQCGWSATDPSHMNDTWVRFIRGLTKDPIEGLYPILDSLLWPEDIENYPPGCCPIEPSFFLFATPQKYYIYHFEDAALYVAGDTLSEVFEGMKVARFHGDKEGDWTELEPHPAIDQLDAEDYFPVYRWTRERGIILAYPVYDFEEEYAKAMRNWRSGRM